MPPNKNISISHYIRALRLPFITASVFPFVAGSILAKINFSLIDFFLGLISVIATHLGANLINDYADSKTGADWNDKNFYRFFGGSKLIQEGIFSEKFYLCLALICFGLAFTCIIILAFLLKSISIIGFYVFILFFGFSYSHKPLQLSYHRLGEVVIFVLFGLAPVLGGYFIQTKIFPTYEGFMVSLPFGFLTTAILYSNEVPDFENDIKARKFTWVSLVGKEKAFTIYYLLILFAAASIVANIIFGYLSLWSLLAFVFIVPTIKAANILREKYENKFELIQSSKLTIVAQAIVSIVLIIDILL